MDEIKWDYEELKRSLLDSASDYDRIVGKIKDDDEQEKTETPSKE